MAQVFVLTSVQKRAFEVIVGLLAHTKRVALVGPDGVGKSLILAELRKLLGEKAVVDEVGMAMEDDPTLFSDPDRLDAVRVVVAPHRIWLGLETEWTKMPAVYLGRMDPEEAVRFAKSIPGPSRDDGENRMIAEVGRGFPREIHRICAGWGSITGSLDASPLFGPKGSDGYEKALRRLVEQWCDQQSLHQSQYRLLQSASNDGLREWVTSVARKLAKDDFSWGTTRIPDALHQEALRLELCDPDGFETIRPGVVIKYFRDMD